METSIIIISLGLLIIATHVFNALFDKTKVPNVLILLTIGIIVGPVIGWVKPEHFGEIGPIFSTVTLVILLFESGINLKLKQIFSSFGSTFLITIFNFSISAFVATLVANLFTSLTLFPSLFFGVIVAGTSSAVVIPVVRQLRMNQKAGTILLLESALTDVLCLVIGLALLNSFSQGKDLSLSEISLVILKSFGIALIIGLIGGFAWSLFLEKIRRIQNSKFISLACVFVIYGITEWLGFNGGIATLVFGITMGNSYLLKRTKISYLMPDTEILEEERNFFAELVFILQTYFFVYVGISIQFGSWIYYVLALVILAGIIASRPLSIKMFVKSKTMEFKDLSLMAVLMPKGLVTAIMATLPLAYGIEGGNIIQYLAYAIVFFSILISSIFVILLSRNNPNIGYLKSLLLTKSTNMDDVVKQDAPEVISEEALDLSINEAPAKSDDDIQVKSE
jgi:NhaP-type Na+/H+ or K+/H+ antiporter